MMKENCHFLNICLLWVYLNITLIFFTNKLVTRYHFSAIVNNNNNNNNSESGTKFNDSRISANLIIIRTKYVGNIEMLGHINCI